MAKGNEIVISTPRKGVFLEGVISGTPKPGALMQVKAATALSSGEPTFELATLNSDGRPKLIMVLDIDGMQGKGQEDAYVSGTRGRVYCPAMGEDLNVRVGEGAGTSNSFAIGDALMLDSDGGNLIPSSGSQISEPFIVMEAKTQIAPSSLVWCKYTGH